MSRELDKILSMLKTVEDPATAVFDLANETAQGFMVVTEELAELNAKIDEAIANRIDGVDGEKGEQGPQGEPGRDGINGRDGKDGADGSTPIKGIDYFDGENGKDGVDGIDGEDGEIGPMPKHEWKGTKIRFEEKPGKWGKWVDLKGETGRALFGGGSSHVQVSDATGLITDNVQTLDFRTGIQVTQVGVDTRITVTGSGVDHGLLSGLGDDDHTQYLLVNGTRAMTGNLNMGGFALYGNSTVGGNLLLDSTSNATKGYIQLGETLQILKDGTFTNAIGVISWGRSSMYEQTGATDRFFFKAAGDRMETLSEDGGTFLLSVRGANASPANSSYFGTALSVGSGYIGGALPSNGLIVQGYTGHGRLMTVEPPQSMLHVREYQANEMARFEGQDTLGYQEFRTYVRGTNELRGRIGYDDTSGTLITNSVSQSLVVRGAKGITLGQGTTHIGALYNNGTNSYIGAYDSTRLVFGYTTDITTPKASTAWDKTDANANCLMTELPTGGAVDVPVHVLGNGIIGQDLALFNGRTQPALAVMSADRTKYAELGYVASTATFGLSGAGIASGGGERLLLQTDNSNGQFLIQPKNAGVIVRMFIRATTASLARFELGEPNTSTGFFSADGGNDQMIVATSSSLGNQLIQTTTSFATLNFRIPAMNEQIFSVHDGVTSPSTDNGRMIHLTPQGLFGGSVDNADILSASLAMETDLAARDMYIVAPSAYASAVTNVTGADLVLRAGNGTTAANNGRVHVDSHILETSGGRVEEINTTAHTANHTVTVDEENVLCDTSGGAFTITLPASPIDGEVHTIILDVAGNLLTVSGNGNNINGSANQTMNTVSTMQFIYNGTQWNIK